MARFNEPKERRGKKCILYIKYSIHERIHLKSVFFLSLLWIFYQKVLI